MRPLHIRLLVSDPRRDDVLAFADALRRSGHVVIADDATTLPEGIAPGPDFVVTEGAAMPAPESLEGAETRHLASVLRFTGGNRRQAALILGIARSTLLAKLRKFGLDSRQ